MDNRLKDKRLELGITVRELVEKTYVSASLIYAIESRIRGSYADKLSRIARVVGILLEDGSFEAQCDHSSCRRFNTEMNTSILYNVRSTY